MIGFEDCESPFTSPRNKKSMTDKYVARHPLGVRQALGENELANVYWSPRTEGPAGSPAQVNSDAELLQPMLQSARFVRSGERHFKKTRARNAPYL